jgi:hypothetical protein
MNANKKQIGFCRTIQAKLHEQGSGLGFTEAQLQFIIEAASFMAQIMVTAPPVNENGEPVHITSF